MVVVASLTAAISLTLYIRTAAARGAFASRIAGIGSGGAPPETIDGLKAAIAKFESTIEANTKIAAQSGIYWKILAVRYIDRGMYGEALEALEQAIAYFPEDATLHYLTGVSAAISAKSSLDFVLSGTDSRSARLLALAEKAHLRAIELDPVYARPRYALGVLYVFELDRSADAIPQLRRYLELEKRDVDAMFVLARAYYGTGELKAAVELYDRIIETTRDPSKKTEAEANKKTLLDELYG
ncbi:MAG: hypothetical protein A2Z99_09020 [Treponema sp. GWB1_62_6]|nr:MAG: hypothetical protein A2Z99_09020 [Treponema sp. GWB1_62_6]OHE63981.1 MAG: hypothetical protein A2001_01835 [Treponema sp. GWC1_61_84]